MFPIYPRLKIPYTNEVTYSVTDIPFFISFGKYENLNIVKMKKKNTFNVLFWARKARAKDGRAPLFCRVTIQGQRYEMPMNLTIQLDKWSPTAQRVIGRTETDKQANRAIEDTVQLIEQAIKRIQQRVLPVTIENLKLQLTAQNTEYSTISKLFEYHAVIEGTHLSEATLLSYQTTVKHLLNFIRIRYQLADYNIAAIDQAWVQEWYAYLQGYLREDSQKRCHVNGAVKHLKRLKKVMNIAVENEWIARNPVSYRGIRLTHFERGSLTDAELHQMERIPLSPTLAIVRDLFMFAAYTGISYIDLAELRNEQIVIGIDSSPWLYYYRHKTLQRVAVPLLEPAVRLIDKYYAFHEAKPKNRIFPVPPNQIVNRYLKYIADLAGIEKNITFHMARHTFATTVTLSHGIPIETVSRMLGHASLSTTQIYAKIVDNKIMDDMKDLRNMYATKSKNKNKTIK